MTAALAPDVRRPGPVRARWWFGGVVALVVGLDQLTKHLALDALADGPVHLLGSLRLRLTFNSGTAFSFGSDRTTVVALVALAIAAVVLVVGLRARDPRERAGYALVLGGALGNLVDRALRDGEGLLGGRVVDFVDLQWWPVFNVADVAICLGVAVLVLTAWRTPAAGAPGT